MSWDDFTKKVKEFFTGKKTPEEVDTSQYADGEKQLNDKLGELEEEYKNNIKYDPEEGYEDLSDVLPEEQTFEYLQYTGDDEEGIKSKTKEKYDGLLDGEKKKVDDALNTKKEGVETKIDVAKDEYSQKQEQLDRDYEDFQKALEKELIKKGLYRSSIKQGQSAAAETSRLVESKSLKDKLSAELKNLNSEIERLQGEAATAIQNLDLEYAQRLDSEIERLLDKRAKEVAAIDKYNNTLKEKEAKYIEDRTKAIEEQLAKRQKDALEIKNMEDKYGYAGQKGESYQKRYDLALEYYSSIPRDAALQMLQQNGQLKNYLGNYYGKLITEIAKKEN